MKKFLSAIVSTCAFLAFATSGLKTDEEVRERVIESTKIFDNPSAADSEMRHALNCCGNDTNRFVRIVQEIAMANPNMTSSMIEKMRKFGNATALPFLYHYMTNAACGEAAADAVLKLEGVTSNSVIQVSSYLSCTNAHPRDRSRICMDMVAAAFDGCHGSCTGLVEATSIRYASSANRYFTSLDMTMCEEIPSYRISKRRLSVLRSVLALGVSQYQIAYVTNAINELVAYPEADLPE